MMTINGARACLVGIGTSDEFGFDLGKSPITLQTEALVSALVDAGLEKSDVDGFATAHGSPTGIDYEEFVVATGLRLRYVEQAWAHGRWATGLLAHAAFAVTTGAADVVAVANTVVTRRGYARHLEGLGGSPVREGLRDSGGGHGEWTVHGIDTPGVATALVARRYMDKYGVQEDDLAEISTAYRRYAQLNPMATLRGKALSRDSYFNEPTIVAPFRRPDFALLSEGSTCLIVTTEERARDLRQPVVWISGFQGIQSSRDDFVMFSRPGLGIGYSYDGPYRAEPQAVYAMADLDRSAIDGLYVYDSFSSNVWMVLERFGFCGEGEAPEWLRTQSFSPEPATPVNTNGGMLGEGDYTGYGHLVEMVRQLRGQAGRRQIERATALQWATPWGDSLILTAA
ncbi:thiolase C-terminal domain-containing protein [Nocardioides cheoyonin]|uniref:thiolase C-terminal domain-containing protein n=1 Tax=Nocardioides cheoyonin TaxID=3156615 RepID=UPI0032B320D8